MDSMSAAGSAIGSQQLNVNYQRQTQARSVNGGVEDTLGHSQGTFKKRTTSVSKPVDKNLME